MEWIPSYLISFDLLFINPNNKILIKYHSTPFLLIHVSSELLKKRREILAILAQQSKKHCCSNQFNLSKICIYTSFIDTAASSSAILLRLLARNVETNSPLQQLLMAIPTLLQNPSPKTRFCRQSNQSFKQHRSLRCTQTTSQTQTVTIPPSFPSTHPSFHRRQLA